MISNTTSSISLGLLGAGRWGKIILRTLESVPGIRVAMVASRNPETFCLVPAGCRVESDWRTIVREEGVDAVLIATPSKLHAEMAIESIEAGKAVFLEKPMAINPIDARRIATLAITKNQNLWIDHLDLVNPAWQMLKSKLSNIGEIFRVEAVFGTSDGHVEISPLWDWGPHAIALCIDLMGEPEYVNVLSDGSLELRFANNKSAKIVLGNSLPARARRLIVIGLYGTLTYDDNAEAKVTLRTERGEVSFPHGSKRPLHVALECFAHEIRTKKPSFEQAKMGVAVVDILAAASLVGSSAPCTD